MLKWKAYASWWLEWNRAGILQFGKVDVNKARVMMELFSKNIDGEKTGGIVMNLLENRNRDKEDEKVE